jgi:dinuclear metal center YbgI/SA1388 family protein
LSTFPVPYYNAVMLAAAFDNFIRGILPFTEMEKADSALNGLQVGRRDREIEKIAFAVDASLESFRRALALKADLLFVHHGLFFGKVKPVTGVLWQRLKLLLETDLCLYAVHLPLDTAPVLGNNAGLARVLGLENLAPFGLYHGVPIGCRGTFPAPRPLGSVVEMLLGRSPASGSALAFGTESVRTVGIVSGGAPECARDAAAEGLDLFVTGEASHEIYHESLEAGLNVIFAGHYATEVYGVESVRRTVEKEINLETVFIDLPTGY